MRNLTNSYPCLAGLLVVALFASSSNQTADHKKPWQHVRHNVVAKPIFKTARDRVAAQLKQLPPGLFVWQSERCLDHSPYNQTVASSGSLASGELLALQAKQAGIVVFVKVHEGDELFSGYDRLFLKSLTELKVPVFVWGYNYARHPRAEAALIKQYLKIPGVLGYIANTEKDVAHKSYKLGLMLDEVKRFRNRHCPEKLLAYSSYAFIGRHQEIDYRYLTAWADFAIPQVYTADFQSDIDTVWPKVKAQWNRQLKTYVLRDGTKVRLPIPLMPAGQAYEPITLSEEARFVAIARSKAPAFCLWSWQQMTPESWRLISRPSSQTPAVRVASVR